MRGRSWKRLFGLTQQWSPFSIQITQLIAWSFALPLAIKIYSYAERTSYWISRKTDFRNEEGNVLSFEWVNLRKIPCTVCNFQKRPETLTFHFVSEKVQSLDLSAIPDMKWYAHPYSPASKYLNYSRSHRSPAPPLLAIADSEGGVTLLEWDNNEVFSSSLNA